MKARNVLIMLLILNVLMLGVNAQRMGGGMDMFSSSTVASGSPDYAKALGVSFDDVSPENQVKADGVITKLANLDRTITLSAEQNERYVNILYKMHEGISCEYCCGARSIIFENGQAACGCAHSYAMRGVAKLLITEYDYTDEEIFEEVAKWKTRFFPTQIEEKAKVLEEKGIETSYTNLASNTYRGIEQGKGAGMVGGC